MSTAAHGRLGRRARAPSVPSAVDRSARHDMRARRRARPRAPRARPARARQRDRRALRVQRPRDRAADAAAGAGDQRASCRSRSNMGCRSFAESAMLGERASTSAGASTGDARQARSRCALGEPGRGPCRRRPRPDVPTPCAAIHTNAFAPAHRAGHLLDQQPADLVRFGNGLRRRRWRPRGTPGARSARPWPAPPPWRRRPGAISAQWNGADTGSMIARLAPFSVAISTARSTAARWPETTTCPGALSLAAAQTSPWRLPRRSPAPRQVEAEQRRHGADADRDRPPAWRGRACAAAARHRRAQNAPAAASAEYSPSEWPATKTRRLARSNPRLALEHAHRPPWTPPSGPAGRSRSGSAGPRRPFEHESRRASRRAPRRPPRTRRGPGTKASASALPMPTAWEPWPGNTNACCTGCPSLLDQVTE